MIALMNWRVWAALALALGLAASHYKAYHMGGASERASSNAEKLDIAQQSLRLAERTTRTTQELQTKDDNSRRLKNAHIAKLDADLAIALERLRDRPARSSASGLPENPGTGDASRGCTGAQLYRSDSEVLTRLGHDADKLRINLKTCYSQYEELKSAINGD